MTRALLGLLLLAGCKTPRTEMVVSVTSELSIPDEVDEVKITVRDRGAVIWEPSSPLCPPGQHDNCWSLPIVAVLYPGKMWPYDPVEVEVAASLQGTVRVVNVARFNFQDGHSQKIDFVLYRNCLDNTTCPAAPNCTATATHCACGQEGQCVEILAEPLTNEPKLDGGTVISESPDLGGVDLFGVDLSGPEDLSAPDRLDMAGYDMVYTGDGSPPVLDLLQIDLNVPQWSTQSSGTNQGLLAVWGAGGSDIWAVGEGATILYSTGKGTWMQQPVPSAAASVDLNGIWGTSNTNVYAVGSGGVILHYTGAQWDLLPSPAGPSLLDVWGSGSGDIYAVGASGSILHSTGGDFTAYQNPVSGVTFNGVWGSSATNIYAVGTANSIFQSPGGGTAFSGGGSGVTLFKMWGTGPNDFFIASASKILHWNGLSYLQEGQSGIRYGIWGSSSTNVYSVGYNGILDHKNGAPWASEKVGNTTLVGVWGSGPNDVYVVGHSGVIYHHP